MMSGDENPLEDFLSISNTLDVINTFIIINLVHRYLLYKVEERYNERFH